MTILLTGGAGFIGAAVAERLLERGEQVVIIDNFNDYYPVSLKRDRIARLERFREGLVVHEIDFANARKVGTVLAATELDRIVHLGAQAGVRYSLDNPLAYAASNLTGHLVLLELDLAVVSDLACERRIERDGRLERVKDRRLVKFDVEGVIGEEFDFARFNVRGLGHQQRAP